MPRDGLRAGAERTVRDRAAPCRLHVLWRIGLDLAIPARDREGAVRCAGNPVVPLVRPPVSDLDARVGMPDRGASQTRLATGIGQHGGPGPVKARKGDVGTVLPAVRHHALAEEPADVTRAAPRGVETAIEP